MDAGTPAAPIPIPLTDGDPDVTLDLQTVFTCRKCQKRIRRKSRRGQSVPAEAGLSDSSDIFVSVGARLDCRDFPADILTERTGNSRSALSLGEHRGFSLFQAG